MPLLTTGGTITLVLRAASGTGEVWLGSPTNQTVTVSVVDVAPPVIVGPANALAANVLRNAAPVPIAIRFSDNGPAIGGAIATVAWGDGTTSNATITAPADPF